MKKNFIIILAASAIVLILSMTFATSNKRQYVPNRSSPLACNTLSFSGSPDFSQREAFFEGNKLGVPQVAFALSREGVLGVANEERWVEVDLSEQKLRAWEGNGLFLETAVSTGLPWWPTPVGEFRIWIKLRATKMEGGTGKNYYYLPNVPYVMYFENDQIPGWRGYGLHGTYWHSDFGRQRSHGCVNLPTPIAEKLYYWVSPVLPEGKNVARSSSVNLGTRVVIHE